MDLCGDPTFQWEVIGDYFKHWGNVRYQVEGYDKFMTCHLQHIVSENSDIWVRCVSGREAHRVRFTNVTVVSSW